MSPAVPFFTPWREDGETLDQRHVGREDLEAQLARGLAALGGGRVPLHVYLFGPRGIGKSHILARLHRAAVRAGGDALLLSTIPEERPPAGTAARLWELVKEGADQRPAWARWGADASPEIAEARPLLVLFDGLGAQLASLPEPELRGLRERLARRPLTWIVGTGVDLPSSLVKHDSAFFGAFAPHPLEPLDDAEAAALLDRAWSSDPPPGWSARRSVLVTLGGGSPRALHALAMAATNAPRHATASDDLLAVVDQLTAHYQLRFKDLGDKAQHVVHLMASAPRELSPSEIARFLGDSPNAISTELSRLADNGVVSRRREGRGSWFTISEPMFRFWIEYRTAPWQEARVAWVGKLLEAALSPQQIVGAWVLGGQVKDPALDRLVRERPEVREHARRECLQGIREALREGNAARLEETIRDFRHLDPDPDARYATLLDALPFVETDDALTLLDDLSVEPRAKWFVQALAVARAWEAGEPPANGRDRLLDTWPGGAHFSEEEGDALETTADRLISSLEARPTHAGRPWALSAQRAEQLASIPFLRAQFLLRGRDELHPALLRPDDVLVADSSLMMVDGAHIVCAGVSLRHPALVTLGVQGAERRPPDLFPACPSPRRPFPCEVDRVVALVWSSWLWAGTGSWFGYLGLCSESPFERALAAHLATRQEYDPAHEPWSHTSVALTTLRQLAPERFHRLRGALGESWHRLFERIEAMAQQMILSGNARLHPEIERLRQLLAAPPDPPDG